ncbi:hypothetical protein NECAME_09750 [Necator americanus]|nr:hypothetical protein NECAME_09750 [Necator americanus]ETN79574.1 hypothetical protein NECAME_09750 [Necator americanus]
MAHSIGFYLVLFLVVLQIALVVVSSFNLPPTGMCRGQNGDNCMRCDCMRPYKCVKGQCR